MEMIAIWFLYFIIYSILGWAAETVYCSVPQGHFVERGFLRGPLCPIYGAGAVIILRTLEPYISNIPVIFILGLLLTSTLEYITSYLMEKIFHMRWWDYSEHRFNIKGRVCLLNSTLFGLLCVVLTELIHPPIEFAVHRLPSFALFLTAAILAVLFITDACISVRATLQLKDHLEKLKEAEEQLRLELSERKEEFKERIEKSGERIKSRIEKSGEEWKDDLENSRIRLKEQIKEAGDQLSSRFTEEKEDFKEQLEKRMQQLGHNERYLLRSFPNLKPENKALERSMERYREAMRKEILKRKQK